MKGKEDLMANLKQRLEDIKQFIPSDRPVAYLDLPIHLNVGDLLINAGTEEFFRHHNLTVDVRLSVKNYQRFLEKITREHTILLHGGGNFGDIWPAHERMRSSILTKFKENKIVMLPQTVHFKNSENMAPALSKYQNLRDCTIFVRDETSRKILLEHLSCPVLLSPDMAHQLWKCDTAWSERAAGTGELSFMRRDREAKNQSHGESIDWEDLIRFDLRLRSIPAYALIKFSTEFRTQQAALRAWYTRRDAIINLSRRQFLKYRHIKTDRLHAMLLGKLIGKEITRLDNSYGKLSSYANAWFR